MNSRLDELQAALLSVRLRWLEEQTERRRDIAARYVEGITSPRVTLLDPTEERAAHVHHLFVVRCAERDELRQHLEDHGVQTLIHYPVPAHLQTPYLSVARDPEGLRQSEQHAETCLSLPCHAGLTDGEVETVIDVVNSFGER